MKKQKPLDLNPKKQQQKIKVVKSKAKTPKPDEQETKKVQQPQKPVKIKAEKQIEKTKQGRNNVFKQIEQDITRKLRSCKVGIYQLSTVDFSIKTVLGEELESLTAEKYFSLGEPTVFINPMGISDDTQFLNRFVTRFTSNFCEYLLVVSSFAFESLTKTTEIEKINKIIKERAI